jgi:hypothetical protein
VLLLVVAILLVAGGGIAVNALSLPGDDSPAAKLAEWARDHGLGWAVTGLEQVGYQADQPSVGGVPDGGIPQAQGAEALRPSTPALAPLAGGAPLPGEGSWQVVRTVRGRPAVQVAFLRPDDQHTSYVAGVLRMDPSLVRGELHPGAVDPGGRWTASARLDPGARGVAAVFNGGFKLSDPSGPGYYSDGRTVRPLVTGAASLVLHTDGRADVGAWGTQVRMAPDVASVRQNLVPLVDDGEVSSQCATGGSSTWGSTIGQRAFVDRSGFGVTADGSEVYVAGPALSVCTLGRLLQDAGVVRGMELDINPSWVSGAYFPDSGAGARLYPAERVPPSHYLQASSRDWYAFTDRP